LLKNILQLLRVATQVNIQINLITLG
jgi:hypothetical protein